MNDDKSRPAAEGPVQGAVGPLAPECSIWYEACKWGTPTIRAVRVIRETAHQIVLADHTPSNARRTKAGTYFPTWDEAHKHLMRETQRELDAARVALAAAQGRHGNVKGLRPNGFVSGPPA